MRPGGEVAGRYRLEELQGHGPMSEVWRAHDGTLDRTVALKVLAPTADLGRFRREAQALAALAHANVMRVYDYGEDDARPFIALEWLSGGTLEGRLAHGPLPADETHRVAAGIAAGLAHLHGRDLVHRDLKPANVLFDEEGRPKLGDFGLARGTAGSAALTEEGTVLGTAAYISPEQAAGQPAGPASDVYSFGVILFRMLTGALPFAADDALALADLHRHAPPPAVEALQPDAPPALAALTAATLRKDPADRPADGEALSSALGAAPEPVLTAADTEATQVLAGTAVAPAAAAPSTRPSRRAAAAAAAALVLLAAAGGVLAWAITRPDATAPAGLATTASAATQSHSHPVTTQTTFPETTRSHGRGRGHAKRKKHERTTTTAPTTAPATTTFPTTTENTTITTPTTTSGLGTTTTVTTATGTT